MYTMSFPNARIHWHTQHEGRANSGPEDDVTCGRSSHNSECSHGFSTNVVTIEQEAGQVLHVVKLTTQDLLGPLAHQSTGRRSHFVLGTRGLARRLHQLTLQPHKKTSSGRMSMRASSESGLLYGVWLKVHSPHHQISADPGWATMACEQKLSSSARYNSMWEGVKAPRLWMLRCNPDHQSHGILRLKHTLKV